MSDFYAFDRHSAQELVRMYHRLRNEVAHLQKQLIVPNRNVKSDWGRVTRTGKTTTNEYHSVYPAKSNGNTFVVQLQTWTFPETPGSTSVTRIDWDQYVIARTEDGSWLPENSYVEIFKQQATGGRRWWIAANPGKSDVIAELAQNADCSRNFVLIKENTAYEIRSGHDIDIESAFNEFEIPAFENDRVLLKWDQKHERYFIAEVKHECVTSLVDVWDTADCFNKIGMCFGAPGARKPEAGDQGCKVWDWTKCDSSSGSPECDQTWLGVACNECPPSSSSME